MVREYVNHASCQAPDAVHLPPLPNRARSALQLVSGSAGGTAEDGRFHKQRMMPLAQAPQPTGAVIALACIASVVCCVSSSSTRRRKQTSEATRQGGRVELRSGKREVLSALSHQSSVYYDTRTESDTHPDGVLLTAKAETTADRPQNAAHEQQSVLAPSCCPLPPPPPLDNTQQDDAQLAATSCV